MRLSSRALGRGPTAVQIVLQHVCQARLCSCVARAQLQKDTQSKLTGCLGWNPFIFPWRKPLQLLRFTDYCRDFFFRATAQMCIVSILRLA